MYYIQWFKNKPLNVRTRLALKHYNCLENELSIDEVRFLYSMYGMREELLIERIKNRKKTIRKFVYSCICFIISNLIGVFSFENKILVGISVGLIGSTTTLLVISLIMYKQHKDEDKRKLFNLYND